MEQDGERVICVEAGRLLAAESRKTLSRPRNLIPFLEKPETLAVLCTSRV